ncbi:MAG TPA: flagellar motor stator protein MotA [Bacteroidota bacterium]|nr:flagellar motor stator protein MotA [Bacteroidota bacterium]
MFILIGAAVVIASVLGGFTMAGGPFMVLVQTSEFVIILGATVGMLLISVPLRMLKQLGSKLGNVLKGDPYTKDEYLKLLQSLFELFHVATRDGLINVEQHVENPEKSAIFQRNKFLLDNHHAVNFLCDTLKLMLSGGVPAQDVEVLLDSDSDTHHEEVAGFPAVFSKIGDSLPGLGIVAAVLGIIIVMQHVDAGAATVGHHVAAALVGTFLGILMSYGFVGPIATNLEFLNAAEARYITCIKAGVIAYAKGNPPVMAVEYARRVIYNDMRPSFRETEEACKKVKTNK